MKILKLPKNKFLRLLINIGLIVGSFFVINKIYYQVFYSLSDIDTKLANEISRIMLLGFGEICWLQALIHLSFWFFITRYIWFDKRKKRVFFGFF